MGAAIGREAPAVHRLDGAPAGPAAPPDAGVGDAGVVGSDVGGSDAVGASTTRPSAIGRTDGGPALRQSAGGTVLRRSAAVAVPPPLLAVTDALPVGPDGGPVGLAAASGRVVVSEDVAADPAWAGLAGAAAAAGIRSSWAAP